MNQHNISLLANLDRRFTVKNIANARRLLEAESWCGCGCWMCLVGPDAFVAERAKYATFSRASQFVPQML